MSLFGKILDKLGIRNQPDAATPATPGATAPGGAAAATAGAAATSPPSAATAPRAPTAPAAPAQPAPGAPPQPSPAMSPVDVGAQLDAMAAANAQKLDWRHSIVDLLKLLSLDSSLESRRELAVELGCPQDKMGDSAQMNVWLHKTVLQRLAANGGNVPAELL